MKLQWNSHFATVALRLTSNLKIYYPEKVRTSNKDDLLRQLKQEIVFWIKNEIKNKFL